MKKLLGSIKRNPILLVTIVGIVLPLLTRTNPYYAQMVMMCIVFAILASSLNIAVGLTGLSNLSHATFFGVGAFVAAILNTRFHVPFYINMVAGGLVAMLFGWVLGAPTLRLKGVFLALVTFAFGGAMRVVEMNWMSLTNGPMGIRNIDAAKIGRWTFSSIAYIYCALALLILTLYITDRIVKSKIGRAFFAIKYDETVAKSMGINLTKYKIGAYVLSACLAGMAGAMYAHYVSFVSPDTVTMADSISVLCMVILGGPGTLVGPVIGATILTLVPEIFRFAQLYRIVFVGVVMVVVLIGREGNWWGTISNKLARKPKAVAEQGKWGGT